MGLGPDSPVSTGVKSVWSIAKRTVNMFGSLVGIFGSLVGIFGSLVGIFGSLVGMFGSLVGIFGSLVGIFLKNKLRMYLVNMVYSYMHPHVLRYGSMTSLTLVQEFSF